MKAEIQAQKKAKKYQLKGIPYKAVTYNHTHLRQMTAGTLPEQPVLLNMKSVPALLPKPE